MNIGFVCSEYFSYVNDKGKLNPTSSHGGFGFLTKTKAEYLAELGYNVHVFTYSSSFDYDTNVSRELNENGVKIHLIQERERFGKNSILTGLKYLFSSQKENSYFKQVVDREGIQILQFEDTPTSLLVTETKKAKKILIFQDPFDYYDANLLVDSEHNFSNLLNSNTKFYNIKQKGSFSKEKVVNFLHKKNFVRPIERILKKSAVESIFTEADFIGNKVKTLFNLTYTPQTLRNPIKVYENVRDKTVKPSFVWVARWDPQKRPDTMLQVASKLPEYDFYLIGTATKGARSFTKVEEKLSYEFSKYPNIHILGFIPESTKREYIGRAWGLINTSIREGLPITFLEALAEGTPIISYVDPDNYSTKFGIKVDYNERSFINGIERAVSEKLFSKVGQEERLYASREHGLDIIMNKHIEIYKELVE